MPDKPIPVTDGEPTEPAILTPEQTGETLPTTDSAATTPDNRDPQPAPVPAPEGAGADTAVQPQQESGDNLKDEVATPPPPKLSVELGEIVHYRPYDDPDEGDDRLFPAIVTALYPDNATVSLTIFYPGFTDTLGGLSEGTDAGTYRTV